MRGVKARWMDARRNQALSFRHASEVNEEESAFLSETTKE